MYDLIRDAPLGQAIRFLSEKRLIRYPEEEASFVLPPQYTARLKEEKPNVGNSLVREYLAIPRPLSSTAQAMSKISEASGCMSIMLVASEK